MSIENILKQLPKYASDVDKSIRGIFQSSTILEKYQLFGSMLTVGYVLRNECLLNNIRPEAKKYLDSNEADACKIAASTISMVSMYNNFSQNVNDEKIKKIPSLLSLDQLVAHNIDKRDFTIYCLAASIVNNCKYCINIHVMKLKALGCSLEMIRDIGRTVSVIKAAGDVLEIERMRSYEFVAREENL